MSRVVVGYDGSDAARDALGWALAHAGTRGLPLTVVTVSELDRVGLREEEAVGRARAGAEAALAAAREQVPDAGGTEVEVRAEWGSPRHVLARASETAALVVVGRRGGGRLAGLRVGSVATAVLHHAASPVVVVPPGWAAEHSREEAVRTPAVVLGYDGSEHSRSALRFAAAEAARRGVPLDVVLAWEVTALSPAGPDGRFLPSQTEWQEAGERVLARARAELGTAPAQPELRLRQVGQPPAAALLTAADGAELLVVGARGLGGFLGLLLGSVSDQVAGHAPCPVAVVRAGQERLAD